MTKYIRLDEVAPSDPWEQLPSAKTWAKGGARDGDHYYRASDYDMSRRQDYSPHLPRSGQDISLREVIFFIAKVCQGLQIPTRIEKYEGEHTAVFSCDLVPDLSGYQGTTSIGILQNALTKELRALHPEIVLDLLQYSNVGGTDHIGNSFTRAWFRVRLKRGLA
jgi:hypothetical protein